MGFGVYLSYHDVCSNNFEQVREHLKNLQTDIFPENPFALMVVIDPAPQVLSRPNFSYFNQNSLKMPQKEESDQAFASFLKDQKLLKSKILMHGLNHYSDSYLRRSRVGVKANQWTSNEAEFAGLDVNDAEILILKAQQKWKELNLPDCDGFVPPTWHETPGLYLKSFELGFDFYEARQMWYYKSDGKVQRKRVLPMSFWGQSLQEFQRSLFWNKLLFRLAKTFRISIRLALHPSDFQEDRQADLLKFLQYIRSNAQGLSYPSF